MSYSDLIGNGSAASMVSRSMPARALDQDIVRILRLHVIGQLRPAHPPALRPAYSSCQLIFQGSPRPITVHGEDDPLGTFKRHLYSSRDK